MMGTDSIGMVRTLWVDRAVIHEVHVAVLHQRIGIRVTHCGCGADGRGRRETKRAHVIEGQIEPPKLAGDHVIVSIVTSTTQVALGCVSQAEVRGGPALVVEGVAERLEGVTG